MGWPHRVDGPSHFEQSDSEVTMTSKRCPYSGDRHSHPMFVYLTSDKRYNRIDKMKQTITPFVLMCENPFDDIHRQNRVKGYRGADHTTRSGQGHLQLEMVIGPFEHDIASKVQRMWRSQSRKLLKRIQVGVRLAAEFHCPVVWCKDVAWTRRCLNHSTCAQK